MQVTITNRESNAAVLALHGQLDIDTAPVLRAALMSLVARAVPRIVVDLRDLHFCDSTGLSAVVVAHAQATDRGGWLRLAAPTAFLRRVLATVGLTDRIDVYPDVEGALAAD